MLQAFAGAFEAEAGERRKRERWLPVRVFGGTDRKGANGQNTQGQQRNEKKTEASNHPFLQPRTYPWCSLGNDRRLFGTNRFVIPKETTRWRVGGIPFLIPFPFRFNPPLCNGEGKRTGSGSFKGSNYQSWTSKERGACGESCLQLNYPF